MAQVPLDAATEAALRASIKRFGVLVPVVEDQYGNLLDGNNRRRIAAEVGVDCPFVVREVADDEEAHEIARTLNEDRRHMPREKRREVVADLRSQGHSLRAIAGAVGVGLGTVERDLATVPGGTVADRITGLDGKSRPASTKKPVSDDPRVMRGDAVTHAEQIMEMRRRGKPVEVIARTLGIDRNAVCRCFELHGGDPAITVVAGGKKHAIDSDAMMERAIAMYRAANELVDQNLTRAEPDAAVWLETAEDTRRRAIAITKRVNLLKEKAS